jgi:hypothetical protein
MVEEKAAVLSPLKVKAEISPVHTSSFRGAFVVATLDSAGNLTESEG